MLAVFFSFSSSFFLLIIIIIIVTMIIIIIINIFINAGKDGGVFLSKILMRMCAGTYLSPPCLANDLLTSLFEVLFLSFSFSFSFLSSKKMILFSRSLTFLSPPLQEFATYSDRVVKRGESLDYLSFSDLKGINYSHYLLLLLLFWFLSLSYPFPPQLI